MPSHSDVERTVAAMFSLHHTVASKKARIFQPSNSFPAFPSHSMPSAKSHGTQSSSLLKVATGVYSLTHESRRYKGSKEQAEQICASGRARRDHTRHRSRPSRRGNGSTGAEPEPAGRRRDVSGGRAPSLDYSAGAAGYGRAAAQSGDVLPQTQRPTGGQIGRASCRERV